MKAKERLEARRLRKEEGKSVKEIARLVGASPGSISLWVRDIELTQEQQERLAVRGHGDRVAVGKQNSEHARRRREQYQRAGKEMARQLLSDRWFVIGCCLYWAEGAKDRNSTSMSNSDPDVLRIFIRLLEEYFGVERGRLSVFCRYYTDLAHEGDPERWWLRELGLPKSCLRRSCVNYYPKDRTMVKRRYEHGKLKYGTCRVQFADVEVMQKLYGAIQEVAGIEKPEWLG